jgi:hypothetical protein
MTVDVSSVRLHANDTAARHRRDHDYDRDRPTPREAARTAKGSGGRPDRGVGRRLYSGMVLAVWLVG